MSLSLRHLIFAAVTAIAPFAAGCGPSVHAEVPSGFAIIESGDDYAFRAANADGVVLGVRSEANKPHGDLGFWSQALTKRLEKRGYATEGAARNVSSREGTKGVLRTFTTSSGGRPHIYWLGVYVTDDDVFVVEATGDAESIDAAMRARIESSIASVDLAG
jgi:hypothetical protein